MTGATMKEFFKTLSGFVAMGLCVFGVIFGYISEIFPRIVPDWVYYIITPVGIAIFIAFIAFLIKEKLTSYIQPYGLHINFLIRRKLL